MNPSGVKSTRFIDCQFTDVNAPGDGTDQAHTRVVFTASSSPIAWLEGVSVAERTSAKLASHKKTVAGRSWIRRAIRSAMRAETTIPAAKAGNVSGRAVRYLSIYDPVQNVVRV